jgi:hypothetical protein
MKYERYIVERSMRYISRNAQHSIETAVGMKPGADLSGGEALLLWLMDYMAINCRLTKHHQIKGLSHFAKSVIYFGNVLADLEVRKGLIPAYSLLIFDNKLMGVTGNPELFDITEEKTVTPTESPLHYEGYDLTKMYLLNERRYRDASVCSNGQSGSQGSVVKSVDVRTKPADSVS